MEIITRFTLQYKEGSDFFNTTDLNDLIDYIDLKNDKEGFPGRHFNIGTEFSLTGGEYFVEGKFRVTNVYTFIQTEHQGTPGDGYNWNFHVIYAVETIK